MSYLEELVGTAEANFLFMRRVGGMQAIKRPELMFSKQRLSSAWPRDASPG